MFNLYGAFTPNLCGDCNNGQMTCIYHNLKIFLQKIFFQISSVDIPDLETSKDNFDIHS